MERQARRVLLAFLVVSLPIATLLAHTQAGPAARTDFYQFACEGWLAANPIPADRLRWGRFARPMSG